MIRVHVRDVIIRRQCHKDICVQYSEPVCTIVKKLMRPSQIMLRAVQTYCLCHHHGVCAYKCVAAVLSKACFALYIYRSSKKPTFSKYLHAGYKKRQTLCSMNYRCTAWRQIRSHSFFYWLKIFSDPLVLSGFVLHTHFFIWLFIHHKEVELWSFSLLNAFYSFWYMVKQTLVMWNKYLVAFPVLANIDSQQKLADS